MWGPGPFYRGGYGLIASTLGSCVLSYVHEVNHLLPLALGGLTAGYWMLGLTDLQQTHQALRRNFPVLIHFRYVFESIRPEIQQVCLLRSLTVSPPPPPLPDRASSSSSSAL